MPIFRMDERGRFVPFEQSAPELEKQLEDWIEQSPHLLLEGEPLAIIGRQTNTTFGKILDLLAVDQNGATVVIELKKGMPPRDVIAQALEYTAWIDSQSQDDLDALADRYSSHSAVGTEGVAGLYDRTFGQVGEEQFEEEESEPSARVTFNAHQRIVIVAEAFPSEMEQTLRYLRERLGVDISAVRVKVHKLDEETLLETSIVVGRERTGSAKVTTGSSKPALDHDGIREKLATEFLREQVDGLEDWMESLEPGLVVRHNKGTGHSIYLNGQWLGGYYFATQWIHFWLIGRVPGDEADMRTLSAPASVLIRPKRVVGNASTESDMEVFKRQLAARTSKS